MLVQNQLNSSNATFNIDPVNNTSSVTTLPQSQIISNDVENNQRILSSEKNKSLEKKHAELRRAKKRS